MDPDNEAGSTPPARPSSSDSTAGHKNHPGPSPTSAQFAAQRRLGLDRLGVTAVGPDVLVADLARQVAR
ncbi:hypothetical protein ACIQV3_39500 [Streptomyces sp. NPDC099050]|uniref:hypothetical protein n=1 Tax=Streptomyces sp. NPDC099050 TaxID=3366100 RepID=UPI003815960D